MSDSGAERGWGGRIRDVGEAFLAVVRAEIAALAGDLGRSGRALLRVLLLALAAAGVLFWTIGLLVYFAIELLARTLPRWGAVGIVLAVYLLLLVILLGIVRRRLRAIEPPDVTIRRRMEENRRWWRERVAPDVAVDPEEPTGGTGREIE